MHFNKIQTDNTLNNLKITTVSESAKRNYKLGIQVSTLPIDRDKYKLSQFGIYIDGVLTGRVCNDCNKEKPLNGFYDNLLFCKDCYGKRSGVPVEKVGHRRKFKELSKVGLQPCIMCNKEKSFDQFRKDKHRKNGVTSFCKSCK